MINQNFDDLKVHSSIQTGLRYNWQRRDDLLTLNDFLTNIDFGQSTFTRGSSRITLVDGPPYKTRTLTPVLRLHPRRCLRRNHDWSLTLNPVV